MRINGTLDGAGLLTHQCELHRIKLTEQELYAQLAKKTSNQITATAGASATSISTGGAVGTGGSAGVASVNGAAGAITIAGDGVTTSGTTITIGSPGGGSGVTSLNGQAGAVTIGVNGGQTIATAVSYGGGNVTLNFDDPVVVSESDSATTRTGKTRHVIVNDARSTYTVYVSDGVVQKLLNRSTTTDAITIQAEAGQTIQNGGSFSLPFGSVCEIVVTKNGSGGYHIWRF